MRYARNGYSSRYMARVTEMLEQVRLQRLITYVLRGHSMLFMPKGRCAVAMGVHLDLYYGSRERARHLITSKARDGANHYHGYFTICAAVEDCHITSSTREVSGKDMFAILMKHQADVTCIVPDSLNP